MGAFFVFSINLYIIFSHNYRTKKVFAMKTWLLFFSLCLPLSMVAQKQAKISVEIASDTIGLNNTIEVAITVENAKVKRFNPPTFEGFKVQGPSTSTSMSFVNGDMSQSTTYTFYLTPREKGAFKIGSASVDTEGGVLKTDEKDIVVVENFDPEIKPQKRRQSMWDDNPFFQRPQIQPTPRPEQSGEKKKKKFETEKI
jgi:hypothetical protein